MMSVTKQITAECDIINCDTLDSVTADTKKDAKKIFIKQGWKFDGRHLYCPTCMEGRFAK